MFQEGKEYERQQLLEFVGSRQNQSGIIWGNREPNCVIVTSGGKHSSSAGYGDSKNFDGSWNYIGQGSKGDQSVTNFANAILVNEERDVLLFSTKEPSTQEQRERGTKRKKYTFEGICHALSFGFNVPTIGKRTGDRLIVFHLVPASNIYVNAEDDISLNSSSLTLTELRKQILNADRKGQNRPTPSSAEYRIRSAQTKAYALLRANGVCELCAKDAPFVTSKSRPFLEVHHIWRLADDGPDLPENVAAICPNCHKEAHYGRRRIEIRDELVNIIRQKELSIFGGDLKLLFSLQQAL